MRSDDARKYTTLLPSYLDLDEVGCLRATVSLCYAVFNPDFSNWNISLFNLDVDLRVVGIDDNEQPAFVNDAWNIRRVEDEQQRS